MRKICKKIMYDESISDVYSIIMELHCSLRPSVTMLSFADAIL